MEQNKKQSLTFLLDAPPAGDGGAGAGEPLSTIGGIDATSTIKGVEKLADRKYSSCRGRIGSLALSSAGKRKLGKHRIEAFTFHRLRTLHLPLFHHRLQLYLRKESKQTMSRR